MKKVIRKILYGFTYKFIDEDNLEVKHLFLNKNKLSYFYLSSNPIIYFTHENKLYYFRECFRLSEAADYFRERTADFFDSLNRTDTDKISFGQGIPIKMVFGENERTAFRAYIDKKENDSEFIKCLSRADIVSQNKGFSIWEGNFRTTSDFFEEFGLRSLPEECRDIALYYIWYMRSVSGIYKTMNIIAGKNHSFFSAVKSVSSQIVAESLGLGHMITRSEFCFLDFDTGGRIFGLLSEAAPGKRMKDSVAEADGSLQRELSNLNLLDIICFQKDHGPNNYNVCTDEKGISSVCAFDNDNPSTFFPVPSIGFKTAGCSPFADKNKYINRPYIDEETAKRLDVLDTKELCRRLKPYLNAIQIYCLNSRIKKLKKAIKRTQNEKKLFFLKKDGWNKETVEKELSGEYGVTYMSKII